VYRSDMALPFNSISSEIFFIISESSDWAITEVEEIVKNRIVAIIPLNMGVVYEQTY
jgi:hypothetical protein